MKATLDIVAPDGTHMVENVDELREVLAMMDETVEHFKTLEAYKLALLRRRGPIRWQRRKRPKPQTRLD